MISLGVRSARPGAAWRGASGAVLACLLLFLGACQTGTVAERGAPAQPAPQPIQPQVEFEPPEPIAPTEPVTRIDPDGPARVGLLLPLSGRHAATGQALLNAAQLAVFDAEVDRFELRIHDTKGTPAGAREAVRTALQEGVHLILGPLFGTSVQAVAPEAQAAGVSVIAFSNDRSVADEGVYVIGLAPEPQVHRIVSYAARQGLVRFAALAPETPYGTAVVRALREATQRNGVFLSKVVLYDPNSQDLSAEVRNLADYDARHRALLEQRQVLSSRSDEAAKLALKRLDGLETLGPPDFEAILVPESGQRLQAVAPMLAYFDVDPTQVRYLGTSLWEDRTIVREPTLQGAWFTAPQPDLWRGFAERYEEAFGERPPRLVTLAYDATALAAVLTGLAVQQNVTPDFGPEVLNQPSGFSGIDGPFRFGPQGEVERNLAILQIRDGEFVVLDPAPKNFQAVGF